MEPIRFENLYDFLNVEINRPLDKIHGSVASDPDELAEAANQVFLSRPFPYTLVEPITTQDGSMTLLAAGSDLAKKVGSVVSRQAKDPENPIGPIVLTPGDSLVGHYRKMILDRAAPALDDMKTKPPRVVARLHGAVKPSQRATMDSILEKALGKSMASAAALMTMIQATRSEVFDSRWRLSLQSAYTGMAIMGALSELAAEENLSPSIERIGTAALFQDLAVIMKPQLYAKDTARHPIRSAQLAESLGFEKPVTELIVNHHSLTDDSADSAAEEKAVSLSVEAKVLVVANLFISAVNESQKAGSDIEAIKGLNYLMGDGKADKRSVVTLTRLYLSQKFALFYEKAMEIASKCVHENMAEPILWNILGERNPQKFICNYKDCAYLGSQQTLVSHTIPVEFDGKVVGKIRKGEYYSCRLLTGELANLYKEIAALSTK